MPTPKDKQTKSARIAHSIVESSELFLRKNSDYGDSYTVSGTILNLIFKDNPIKLNSISAHIEWGLLVRILDKILRASHLRFVATTPQVLDESAVQTIRDCAVYLHMWADTIENKVGQ